MMNSSDIIMFIIYKNSFVLVSLMFWFSSHYLSLKNFFMENEMDTTIRKKTTEIAEAYPAFLNWKPC
ncbi:hypothetical protein D3C73_1441020 [compost metagenome]